MILVIRLVVGLVEFGWLIDIVEEFFLWFEEWEFMILVVLYWLRYWLLVLVCCFFLFLFCENSDCFFDDCFDLFVEDIVEEGVLIGC